MSVNSTTLAHKAKRVADRVLPLGSRRREAAKRARRAIPKMRNGVLRSRETARRSRMLRQLSTPAEPVVSVVIPVYGKINWTLQCLRSVVATTQHLAVEIIVVDDESPDDTAKRLAKYRGIKLVKMAQNGGFLLAANAGIAAATAPQVLLLNNDTETREGWLDALLAVMADESVGLVGAKLVYPDGRLQEAGGVIFSDGTGWNYGRLDDPSRPEYNYRRDVDYCSGAAIMVRAKILQQTGGFDERFIPAYYEDTDLAFQVRALGYRTVFEPRSVVVHHEGISHGTDETAGVKAYQVVNREKFEEKWRAVLSDHVAPVGFEIYAAAQRLSGSAGTVLIIDEVIPQWTSDAGSVRMLAMIQALRARNFAVVLVTLNPTRYEPFATALEELGVQVRLDGPLGSREFIQRIANDIRFVIAVRPSSMTAVVEQLEDLLGDMPIIFDTVDLHFLRGERARALDPKPIARLERFKMDRERNYESSLAEMADATIVVSPVEKDILDNLVPAAKVHVLPTVHAQLGQAESDIAREGLMFVGNFKHTPNVDGLEWFLSEVYPLVRAELGDVPVRVVGQNPPPQLVDSAPPSFEFLGWVEDLSPVYLGSKVAVAPLRFGAGVKGKISEAWTHGVPVVMTSVGAEGMHVQSGETALVADTPAEFANSIAKLLTEKALWHHLSHAAREHVETHFGQSAFERALDEILRSIPSRERQP